MASEDLVDSFRACLAQNVADLKDCRHLKPTHYSAICRCVSRLLQRLGKVASLASDALAWPPNAIDVAVAEDPERFTTLASMMDADIEENCYPPHCLDSRSRAINCVKNSLEFTVHLFNNIQSQSTWKLHKCASDAYLRSLGKGVGKMQQQTICLAMRSLGDHDWFAAALGTTRSRLVHLIELILVDAATIFKALVQLHKERNIPYEFPAAAKSGKKRRPYQKLVSTPSIAIESTGPCQKSVTTPSIVTQSTAAATDEFDEVSEELERSDSFHSVFSEPDRDVCQSGVSLQEMTGGCREDALSGLSRQRRYDFGPACLARCTSCGKCSLNRGNRETREVYCWRCFQSRPCQPLA